MKKKLGVWILLGMVLPLEAQTLVAVRWWMRRYDQQGDNSIRCYMSTDGGNTWTERGYIDSIYANDAGIGLAITPDQDLARLYFLFQPGEGYGYGATRVYYSSDTGRTWQPMGILGYWNRHDYATAGLIAVSGGKLLAFALGTDDCLKIRFSLDSGCNWTPLPDICMGYANPDPEGDIVFDDLGRTYIINWQNESPPICYISTDWGESWFQGGQVSSTRGDMNCRVSDITFDPLHGELFAVIWTALIVPTVYSSTDRGITWQHVGNLPYNFMYGDGSASITSDSAGNLYVLVWDNQSDLRLFTSTDRGITWSYRSTVAMGHADRCACGSEIVSLNALPLSSKNEVNKPLYHVSIANNAVVLNLQTAGSYSLEVYDPLGRQTDCLWNGRLSAGEHRFKLGKKKRGIYFLRISSAENSLIYRFIR